MLSNICDISLKRFLNFQNSISFLTTRDQCHISNIFSLTDICISFQLSLLRFL